MNQDDITVGEEVIAEFRHNGRIVHQVGRFESAVGTEAVFLMKGLDLPTNANA